MIEFIREWWLLPLSIGFAFVVGLVTQRYWSQRHVNGDSKNGQSTSGDGISGGGDAPIGARRVTE